VVQAKNTQASVSPRLQHAAVERYLNALEAAVPRVDLGALELALVDLEEQIEKTSDLERLALVQKRIEVKAQHKQALEDIEHFLHLENRFVAVAAEWAAAQGITYLALQRAGVPTLVLDRTGIPHPK
jgi:hypothetical protein